MLQKMVNKVVGFIFTCKTQKFCHSQLVNDKRMCRDCEIKMELWYKGIYKP